MVLSQAEQEEFQQDSLLCSLYLSNQSLSAMSDEPAAFLEELAVAAGL